MSRVFTQDVLLLIVGSLFIAFNSLSTPAQDTQGASVRMDSSGRGEQSVDIPSLLRQSDHNGEEMHKRLSEYMYMLKKTRRILDERGKVVDQQEQVFEAFPAQRQHILIQLSNNGTALPGWMVDAERKRAGEALEKVERDEQGPNKKAASSEKGSSWHVSASIIGRMHNKVSFVLIDLAEFLRSCEFSSPRRERLDGREVIALNFRPRDGVKLPPHESFISKLEGIIWIDAKDKVVIRLEGKPMPGATQPVEGQAAKSAEASLIYQQVRLPNGSWFPRLIRMNAAGDATLFNGLNWDVLFEFTDYKHFITDVGGMEYKEPKTKP